MKNVEKERYKICGLIQQNIEDLIERKKKEQGINYKSQANEIGITPSALSKYISGNAVPDGRSLYKMAKYYKCSVDYLLGLNKNPTKNLSYAKITEKLGLLQHSIQFLEDSIITSDERMINTINLLLATKEGRYFMTYLANTIYSDIENFDIPIENQSIAKNEINVKTTQGGFNLFAKDVEAILYFNLRDKLKILKETRDNYPQVKLSGKFKYHQINPPFINNLTE